MKPDSDPPRTVAHALYALTSLAGILAMRVVILRGCPPEAPLAQLVYWLWRVSGAWCLPVWVLGAVALWFLLLSRIYGLKHLLRISPGKTRQRKGPEPR